MNRPSQTQIEQAYSLAKERYAALGVDTDKVLAKLKSVSISLHCWQGDDVGGFENPGGELGGGPLVGGLGEAGGQGGVGGEAVDGGGQFAGRIGRDQQGLPLVAD